MSWIGDADGESGDVAAMLESVRIRVEHALGERAEIVRLEGRPPDSWDARRKQHSSTHVLRWLGTKQPAGRDKLVAVMDGDLFIPVLTYVFGEAVLDGPVAVVSTARLGVETTGRRASPRLRLARIIKECIHELGHTYGLIHCEDPLCVMARSVTVVDIDRKQPMLCDSCLQALEEIRQLDEGGEE